jgi:SAM-dependent methyltransferase
MHESEGLKIELGGGLRPCGDGFVNVDKLRAPGVDHVCDFERDDLPFADDSAVAVYSSHCFEHFDYLRALHEIVRVCRLGAVVTIRVPCWLSENALTPGHVHTIGPEEAERFGGRANEHYWHGCRKRLELIETRHIRGRHFDEVKLLFPHLTDEQVLRFIPNACSEIEYLFRVVENC